MLPMPTDPISEWQRLVEHYRGLNDDELQGLAADFADLTDSAQQALRSEMRSRGLDSRVCPGAAPQPPRSTPITPQAPVHDYLPKSTDSIADRVASLFGAGQPELVPDEPATAEIDGPVDYTWKTLLCDCDAVEQAWQIQEVLRRAGIESWIDRPQEFSSAYAGSTGPPGSQLIGVARSRVLVAADQLEQAREIAARPIPPEIVAESQTSVPEFTAPSCPKCGAPDPILEGVDPVNSWKCEQCGEAWSDPDPTR
jgi:hypothetical protein